MKLKQSKACCVVSLHGRLTSNILPLVIYLGTNCHSVTGV